MHSLFLCLVSILVSSQVDFDRLDQNVKHALQSKPAERKVTFSPGIYRFKDAHLFLTIQQEYQKEAPKNLLMDTGAIYVYTQNTPWRSGTTLSTTFPGPMATGVSSVTMERPMFAFMTTGWNALRIPIALTSDGSFLWKPVRTARSDASMWETALKRTK